MSRRSFRFSSTGRTLLWLAFAVAVSGSTLVAAPGGESGQSDTATQRAEGRALFFGEAPLHARLYTHSTELPPEVVRCANCHAVHDGPPVPQSKAPRLQPDLLLKQQSRRGGPASRYDAASFCSLLRKGTDSAQIIVDTEMPRYTLADKDCMALWRFITEKPLG